MLVEGATGVPSCGPVPLPRPSDVLYAPPNPDGSRKRCLNCMFYADVDVRCIVLGRDVEVTGDMVCGLHTFGAPQMYTTALGTGGEARAQPEELGLIVAPIDGTSCDGCTFYTANDPVSGTCRAVADEFGQFRVAALGCCARWQPAQP